MKNVFFQPMGLTFKINRLFNRSFNRSFNHSFNCSFNHLFNCSFNHLFNCSANLQFNRLLNCQFNRSFNHSFNCSFNRLFNPSVNCLFNHSFNPRSTAPTELFFFLDPGQKKWLQTVQNRLKVKYINFNINLVNCDCLFVISYALQLNKSMNE